MSTPSCRSKPPVRRCLLERFARPLLARFLTTHASEFCAAHDFPIDALAASDPRDRALVHRLFELLVLAEDASPPLPDVALRRLALLEALATSRGGERLLDLDTGGVLPRAKLGDEDLAITALLDHPELAARAHGLLPTDATAIMDGFTEYDPATRHPLRFGDAERTALEGLLGEELEARGRTRYCALHVSREPRSWVLEIRHGRRPKTRERLDADAMTVTPATEIVLERACAEIDRETGRLALRAPHPAVKEALRKILGRVLAGDEAHFTAARLYDLSPFRDLGTALTPHGERLLAVALHRLTVRTPAETEIDLSRPARDLRRDEQVASLLASVTRIGMPVAVRLHLTILDRSAALKVELSAKHGRNRLQFDRSDPEVVAIVRGYLLARGVLRELAVPTGPELAASA